jgi:NAD(P)-dependent dehydrogenase (short-subunit alcohol dehydrogenase family)
MPEAIKLVDPRTQYPQPPFKNQTTIDMPGSTAEMNPKPDHGETSYQGNGKLAGCVALITGGDSGIGRAVAIAYAREGAHVAINFLSETEDAKDTLKLIEAAGVKSLGIQADLRIEANCKELIEKVVSEFGKVDILVNNAAYQETRDGLDEMESELFDRIFKTNVYAPFWLSKAALKHLTAGGSIINTASIQGFDPTPALLPYASTKSAVLGMTKALSGLAIKQGIRVNAVAPGPVWTPLIPGSMDQDSVKNFGGSTAFERCAQPVELAPLYVWLASPEASYVTGETFGATGGKMPI